jgi:hypothetical protein
MNQLQMFSKVNVYFLHLKREFLFHLNQGIVKPHCLIEFNQVIVVVGILVLLRCVAVHLIAISSSSVTGRNIIIINTGIIDNNNRISEQEQFVRGSIADIVLGEYLVIHSTGRAQTQKERGAMPRC